MKRKQRTQPVPEGGGGRARRDWSLRRHWSWKRAALAVVALFVVVSVGRSLLPALGVSLPGRSSSGKPTTQAKNPPQPTVNLDGVAILGGGQPIITLNPGLVRPGSTVAVNGSGFDAGARVDLLLGTGGGKARKAQQLATVTVAKDGTIAGSLPFPAEVGAGGTNREVTAQQRNSDKVAKAEAVLAQGTAQATLSAAAAKPGDTVSLSAKGFASGEDLGVYWGRVTGDPSATVHADSGGSISKVGVQVGIAPVGPSSLFVVGRTSGSAASAPFQMLALYPTITVKPYAVKAMQRIGFSGKGFVPGERVLLHVNSAGGPPVAALTTDQGGGFGNAGFVVPYELTGKQALVFIGEQSRSMANAGFTVLPYLPQARASVYGGLPGTAVTFYATNFGPDEAVHVYVGRGQGSQGELVSAFRVDGGGKARSAGSYMIPGNAGNQLTFTLVGARSKTSATATVKVDNSGGPVEVPPQPKYNLPKDLER
jgi:hypothetical protein